MKLSVLIGADDRQLQDAIKRSKQSLKNFGGELRSATVDIAKWGAAVVAAGTAITVHMVKGAIEAADAQAKLAQSVHSSFSSISTLEIAGERAGVGLEQITKGAEKLDVTLGKVATNADKGAAAALERLGLKARELQALPVDQRIASINDAISKNIPITQQAAVAAEIFGDKMQSAMRKLSGAEIRDAAKDAEFFGLSLSAIDAKKLEMANDAFDEMNLAAKGVWRTISVELSPVIIALWKEIRKAAEEAGGFKTIALNAFDKIMTAAGFVADAVDAIGRVFSVVADGIVIGVTYMARLVADTIAALIGAMDKIPGVDFTDAYNDITRFSKESTGAIEQAKAHIDETLMKPMPSESLKKFVADARAAADEVARIQVDAAKTQPVAEEEQDDGEQEKFQKRIDAIRNRFVTEQELTREHKQVLADIERAWFEGQFATDEEFYAIREQAEADHMERLKNIREKTLTDIQKFQQMNYKDQAKTIFGELANITSGVAQHNKTLFRMNQVAGISNAIISAYEGISLTLSKYPFPLNVAMAAAHGAAAFAQVNAIRSQTFGGGGGAAPALAGGTPATPVTPVGGGSSGEGGGGSRPTSIINLQGEFFSRDSVRKLVERINEESGDGGRLIFA